MNFSSATGDTSGVGIDLSLITIIIYIIFGSLGMCGNGLVLLVFTSVKELRDITNLLIANQALIDFTSSVLLLAIYVIPLPTLPLNNPILARFLCGFWYTQYPFWSTYAATIINLVVLTTERYVAVVHPLKYRNRASLGRAAFCASIPWLYGFLHMSYLIPLSNVRDQTCYQFLWPNEIMQPAMGAYTFFILFLAPFAVMTIMCVKIVRVLQATSGQFSKDHASVHQVSNTRDRARRNVVKTMMILCVCYGICWAPNNVVYLYYCLGGFVDFNGVFYYVTVVVAFVNIWINPFVYALQYQKFQQGLKHVFCRSATFQESSVETVSTDVGHKSSGI